MKFIVKTGLVVIGAMFIVGSVLPSFAQTIDEAQSQEKEKKSDGRIQKMVEELSLTPEQKETIKQQRNQNIGKVKILRRRLQETRKLLKEELDKPNSDVIKIKGLAAEIKEIQGNIVDMRISQVLELKKTLTPQQYQLLQEKIKERTGKHFKARQKKQCQQGKETL